MSNVHTVKTEHKEYTLNFRSYAVMMLYRTYTIDQINELSVTDLNFCMIKYGLSDNGRIDVKDADVYDFIDEIGGATSEMFVKTILGWSVQAITVQPAESKKKEDQEAIA